MTETQTAVDRQVEHAIDTSAAAEPVFGLIADVRSWPLLFGPTVHAEILEKDATSERLQIWATAGDEVKTWTSRRTLDPEGGVIRFAQEIPQSPIAAMRGEWRLVPLPGGGTRIVLQHEYSAESPDRLGWIDDVVDHNSTQELAALRDAAESNDAGLTFSFTDTVSMTGPLEAAYEFIYQAARWPGRLPHVARVDVIEPTPGIQIMEMDTSTADGTVHTTKSVRICFRDERILYKQLHLPALLSAHAGEWNFIQDGDKLQVSSTHGVTLKPPAVPEVLGENATIEEAHDVVHNALSRNSTATLQHTKAYVEEVAAG